MREVADTFPRSLALSRLSGWLPDARERTFHRIRFNYLIEQVRTSTVRPGDEVGHRTPTEQSVVGNAKKIGVPLEQVDIRDTINSHVSRIEKSLELSRILACYRGAMGVSQHRDRARREVAMQLHSAQVQELAVTPKVMTTYGNYRIRDHVGDAPGPQTMAMLFQRCRVDVYLVCMDFLWVKYHNYAGQLRLRRMKSPALMGPTNAGRSNEINMMGYPLGSLSFWRPDSVALLPTSGYVDSVGDPLEVAQKRLEKKRTYLRSEYPRIPSLYQLSNVAFPLRADQASLKIFNDAELLDLPIDDGLTSVPVWKLPKPIRTKRRRRNR